MAPTSEKKPDAFLSYTRTDDVYSGGQITRFREHLERAVRAVTGKPFVIFQDVEGIGLGEHWPGKLDEMLDQTRFFLPMITPSYFESEPCQKELQCFLEAEQRAGRKDLILPIYCIGSDVLDVETLRSENPQAAMIHERQRYDWRHLLFESIESKEVRVSLQDLAHKIRGASNRSQSRVILAGSGRATNTQDSNSLLRPPGTIFRDVEEPWCPETVVIPAGVFSMGSRKDEADQQDCEGPKHRVEIQKPFALGRYPVTRGQFAAFVNETGHESKGAYVWTGYESKLDEHADWQSPGFKQTDLHPVVCVSHKDALAYLGWLSQKTGQHYLLPSEAMWEYACRADTTTPFWTGTTITTDQANYNGNLPYVDGKKGEFRQATTEVDYFAANPFGLHDMHGNILEWCADLWHENYHGAPTDGSSWLAGKDTNRVGRGGNWLIYAMYSRSAYRFKLEPSRRGSGLGFRCARVLEQS